MGRKAVAMKDIKLTKGLVALVDDCDFEELSKFKWYARRNKGLYYAERDTSKDGKRMHIRMHRQIMGFRQMAGT
jgi:hypothetical protein